ncbi:UNVERIFIED_CONTAM: hypothetical protein Slati_0958400 [Sesamum latifolium]|uniref:Uncharacterized protein n=1 Tax=Sesamum latifolium TaxID=2727402 RepID=A0AAW2XPW2_9LAMI
MFSKYLRDHASGGEVEGPPLPDHLEDPASSESKGKRPAFPSPGVTPGGSSKKATTSPLGIPPTGSSRSSSTPPRPPPFKDERGVPPKPARGSSDCLYSRHSFEHERKENS